MVLVVPLELHPPTFLFVFELAAHCVGRITSLDFQAVDIVLEDGIEDTDDANDCVQFAGEVLVQWALQYPRIPTLPAFSLASMRASSVQRRETIAHNQLSTACPATIVPTYKVTYHTNGSLRKHEKCYVPDMNKMGSVPPLPGFDVLAEMPPNRASGESLPFLDVAEEAAGTVPTYETTAPCDEKGVKKRQKVAHMDELKAEESIFLEILLSLHYHSQLLMPWACSINSQLWKVVCTDCLQAELLCPQCWVNKHRTMPKH
ncbi:hypothetical protein B0H17DRAFT_1204526 [Mycena rosella]|uniref:Uncharacterized protein n=1 Tax=Mycena rosella TaxID=1033263 RepID=A0AAD7D9H8_MYCRO|nr:hypothetical protein B0H17DRAFT_1204526 [Mycena rosella]